MAATVAPTSRLSAASAEGRSVAPRANRAPDAAAGPSIDRKPTTGSGQPNPLATLACPNEDCSLFNRFDAGNLSVVEWIGKRKDVRRLYCSYCGQRFSERRGTLRQYSKLPHKAVERVLKCLSHGCSVRAAANDMQKAPEFELRA